MLRTKRERVFVLIGAVIVVALLAWNSLTAAPAGAARRGKLLPPAEAYRKRDIAQRTATQLDRQRAVAGPVIARLTYGIAPEAVVPRVVEQLQSIASRSGVHLGEIRPLKVVHNSAGDLDTVPVEVQIHARFQPNLVRFLYDVEDPTGRFVVRSLDLTSADARRQTLDARVEIAVFVTHAAGPGGKSKGKANA